MHSCTNVQSLVCRHYCSHSVHLPFRAQIKQVAKPPGRYHYSLFTTMNGVDVMRQPPCARARSTPFLKPGLNPTLSTATCFNFTESGHAIVSRGKRVISTRQAHDQSTNAIHAHTHARTQALAHVLATGVTIARNNSAISSCRSHRRRVALSCIKLEIGTVFSAMFPRHYFFVFKIPCIWPSRKRS